VTVPLIVMVLPSAAIWGLIAAMLTVTGGLPVW